MNRYHETKIVYPRTLFVKPKIQLKAVLCKLECSRTERSKCPLNKASLMTVVNVMFFKICNLKWSEKPL